MNIIKSLLHIFCLLVVPCFTNCMDFNDGMKDIRSYQDLCQMHKEASVGHGDAMVAYRVDRRSRFYTRCNLLLDVQDQKLMTSKEHMSPRVHYAIIEKNTYADLPPSSFSYSFYRFVPILIKGNPIPQLEIVDCPQIARLHDKCFLFPDECNYFDKTEFRPGACYFPKREKINIIRSCDKLRMRAINGVDALILLKWFEQQKVSVGWQDQSVVLKLKKKFEQDFGFSYDSRGTIKQKLC